MGAIRILGILAAIMATTTAAMMATTTIVTPAFACPIGYVQCGGACCPGH